MWLFPEWQQDWGLIISLALGVIVAAVGFLADFRVAFEQQPQNNTLKKRETGGGSDQKAYANILGNNNIHVGPISNSTGVAIGENARSTVTQNRTINPSGVYDQGEVNTQEGNLIGREKD